MNKQVEQFLAYAFVELVKNRVELQLLRKSKVMLAGDVPCNGYFIDDGPILALGVKKPLREWLMVFIVV